MFCEFGSGLNQRKDPDPERIKGDRGPRFNNVEDSDSKLIGIPITHNKIRI